MEAITPNNIMDAENSDTPMTDAVAQWNHQQGLYRVITRGVVDVEFARQIERELNKTKHKLQEVAIQLIPTTVDAVEREEWRQEREHLRRQNERLRELLEQTRHYSIGPLVPTTWFIDRDKALAAQPEEKP